jgi:tripartite-type tricarboxylate transporter receptor subunit TctC
VPQERLAFWWLLARPTRRRIRRVQSAGSFLFRQAGPSDILARLIGQSLTERLGQPFVIENRAGASGNVGTQAVVAAPPDGHTLLFVAAPNAINVALYPNLGFNFVRDIAPVATIARGALIMLVAPSFPAESVAQFITYAKANPGKINMASAGNGTPPHVAGELFKAMTGIDMVHVPYRGVAPAITDLLGGQVHVLFDPVPSSIGYVRSGKLRALAVTTAERSQLLPDTPALSEFVPGYEASTWFGAGAPRETPGDIVGKLNSAINAVLGEPAMKARLADLGASVFTSSSADFGKFVAAEADKWGKVVTLAGIKPD